jgi:Protein of unknown function (DUF3089)
VSVRRAVATVATLALLAACGGSLTSTATSAATLPATVWLCKPGLRDDPCTSSLTATVIGRSGITGVQHASVAAHPPIDCFYVYPTVSEQAATNANLHIDPQERAVAIAQASRFSQVCRVFAPMYRQVTLRTLAQPNGLTAAAAQTAYAGVAAAFTDYLEHDNHGRGFVLIGHSQGASVLIPLIKAMIDQNPSLRRRLVSALLLGGNVLVSTAGRAGGDFAHIPACASTRQTGCVVAYSSFNQVPPPLAFFGRVTSALDPLRRESSTAGLQVLCVNPASPAGGSGTLLTYLPTTALAALGLAGGPSVTTPWIAYAGEYTGHCEASGGANWLQIDRPGGAADHRPAAIQLDGPNWGLHTYDVNIALGNLVGLVDAQSRAYRG